MLLLIALMIGLAKLPKVTQGEKAEIGGNIFRFPQVWLGMAAVFFFVGSEVSVGSFLIKLFGEPEMGGMTEDAASTFVALYWGGAMIGRFMGSVSLSQMANPLRKQAITLLAGLACFGVILMAISIKSGGFAFVQIAYLLIPMLVAFVGFQIGKGLPAKTLGIFALIVVALLLATTILSGPLAMWAVVGIGIFNSIMWSNVFSISLEGLGKYKSQASSLLVMMVIGGAVFPLLQGWVADMLTVHKSYFVPIAGYIYLAFYGFYGPKLAKKQQ
jgi:FHS family L-fucose permease-like MFS transporter